MIQRYGFNGKCDGESGQCLEDMAPDDDGEFVLFYDHEAEVERLRHDIERHMALLTEFDNEVEQLRAERAALRAEVNEFRRALRSVVRYEAGHEWDGTKMCHTPLIKIEFSDVPAGEPNTAVGWLDRDAFSASIDAARDES